VVPGKGSNLTPGGSKSGQQAKPTSAGPGGQSLEPPSSTPSGHASKLPTSNGKGSHAPKPPTPGGKNGSAGKQTGTGDYHLRHGKKFRGGYCYCGRHHKHWTHRYWWGRYGCFTYWCPCTLAWYYWYGPDNCYYPVSFIEEAVPQMESPPVNVLAGVMEIANASAD
jgi:hypothetical protein